MFSLYHFSLKIMELVHNLILSFGSLWLCILLIKTSPQLVDLQNVVVEKNGDFVAIAKGVFSNVTAIRTFQEGKVCCTQWMMGTLDDG